MRVTRAWWVLLFVFIASFGVLLFAGKRIAEEAPPIALKRFKARIWSGGRVRGPRGIRAEGGREGDFVAVRAVRRMPHRSFV